MPLMVSVKEPSTVHGAPSSLAGISINVVSGRTVKEKEFNFIYGIGKE